MSALPVSIVMCSRNRPELLGDTVRSVLATHPVPAELVVVDQGDVPDAAIAGLGTVGGCRVVHVPSTTRGLSRARNIGLRAAAHPVVVLLDDDMLVEPGWLEPLVTAVAGSPGTVATGRVLAAPPEDGAAALPPAALVADEEPRVARGPQPRDVMPGANVAVHRDEVLALGGYDERLGAGTRFGAADDNDMGHRLLRAGATIRHSRPRSSCTAPGARARSCGGSAGTTAGARAPSTPSTCSCATAGSRSGSRATSRGAPGGRSSRCRGRRARPRPSSSRSPPSSPAWPSG